MGWGYCGRYKSKYPNRRFLQVFVFEFSRLPLDEVL